MKKRLFIFSLFLVLLLSVSQVDAIPIDFHCESVFNGEAYEWMVVQSPPTECSCGSGDGDGSGASCQGQTEVCGGCYGCLFESPGCSTGNVGTCTSNNVGICAPGIKTCTNCESWSGCLSNIPPGYLDEICSNGLDDDCDGYTDEGCGYGDCYIAESCVVGDTSVFEVSETSNAHIGLFGETDYSFKVCCEAPISRSEFYPVVRFSEEDNAHVQAQGSTPEYSIPVGFEGAECNVDSSCSEEEFCVFNFQDGLGNENNSHVAGCEVDYANSVCCVAGGSPGGDPCEGLGGECDINITSCEEGGSLIYIPGSNNCYDSCYNCLTISGYSCNSSDGILNPGETCDLAMPGYNSSPGEYSSCSGDDCTWECSPPDGGCGGGTTWDEDECQCVDDSNNPGGYSPDCEGVFRIKEDCFSCYDDENAPSDVCDGSVEGYREVNYYLYMLDGAENLDYCDNATQNNYTDCTYPLNPDCWFSNATIGCFLTGEEVPFFDTFSLIFALMILTSYYVVSRKQKVL